MKTKEQIQKLIEEKQKELDQLKQELQTAKSPKEAWSWEYQSKVDNSVILSKWQYWFENKESENLVHEQFRLMKELQTFAKLRNGDWVADWGDESQGKFGITLEERKAKLDSWGISNGFVYGISFPTKEIAAEALEIFGERIEQFYGK